MKHVFCRIATERIPVIGDLIRNPATADFINIVLEVKLVGFSYQIRSVRYGKTNKSSFLLLNGQRSRWFKWVQRKGRAGWEIVEEFAPLNNSALRESILASLKDVDTSFTPPAL